jgi:hypothetical protein
MFYEAENADGERGLVPSNYVEEMDVQPRHDRSMQLLPVQTSSAFTMTSPASAPQLRIGATQTTPLPLLLSTTNCHSHQWSKHLFTDRNDVPAPPLNVCVWPAVRARTHPYVQLHSFANQRVNSEPCLSPQPPTQPLAASAYRCVDDYALRMGMGEPVNAVSSMTFTDNICPYPPVDVTRVSVHEIRQPEGTRGVCDAVHVC